MPRRTVLTERQRALLFGLPTDEVMLLRHYILSDGDVEIIQRRRRPENRLGFALQLCALRYPGRLLQRGEVIPEKVVAFIGAQLGLTGEQLLEYAARRQTRYQHSSALQKLYGYRPFEGLARREFLDWLAGTAEAARTNEGLAQAMVDELRDRHVIVPAPTTVERLCADALVAAEREITARIAGRLDGATRWRLLGLLTDTVDRGVTRFVWLRSHEPGHNSNGVNQLLDRLDWIRELGIASSVTAGIPAHRVARLRRQGERYFADGMRELSENRRLAILAVCTVEWRATILDAVIETHDRIVGRLYRAAERARDAQIGDQRAAIEKTLKSFANVGAAMVAAREAGEIVERAVHDACGWSAFGALVEAAFGLTAKIGADPLDFVTSGYARFRRYAPRLLEALDLKGGRSAAPLLSAIAALRSLNQSGDTGAPDTPPVAFARPKWRKRLHPETRPDRKTWETAILFTLRDALRAGDVWLEDSRRHREVSADLIPATAAAGTGTLAVPLDACEWIETRKAALSAAIDAAGEAARRGTLPNGAIENGALRLEKLERPAPAGTEDLILTLYQQVPPTRITDILLEVDDTVGFSDAFTNLRTGAPCCDRVGLLTVLLADGVNLGLKKMAAATSAHGFWELLRIARWHVQEDAYHRALAMIVEAQGALPMARFWGSGLTASADGQFFPAGGAGEAMNLVNARYGFEPGLKAYSHVSDQFAPFATQAIPATVHEAPYILDGLLMNEAGRRIREQYADTGGFTDHVFAMCAILGFSFAPRIRDLPSKRLYAFAPAAADDAIRPLIAGKIRQDLIERNWPDILRLSASAAVGAVAPSRILKRLASYPRQNDLALALREVGRVERSIFMLRWIMDAHLQRRAQMGLNKGEAHHALKRAISFNRKGEIRDRTTEGQHYRIAGMNLLAAVIIYWNTSRLSEIVANLTANGDAPPPELLAHVSPLGWEHINLTGEYRWARA